MARPTTLRLDRPAPLQFRQLQLGRPTTPQQVSSTPLQQPQLARPTPSQPVRPTPLLLVRPTPMQLRQRQLARLTTALLQQEGYMSRIPPGTFITPHLSPIPTD